MKTVNVASLLFFVLSLLSVVAVLSQSNKKESPCSGEWKWPTNCTGYGCVYSVQWSYIDQTDDILFVVSSKHRNKWTGVGFSADKQMSETDAIVGLVPETGRFFVMDMWLTGYEVPPLDQEQNLHNMTAWSENGITSIQFYRKRVTGDKYDFQFTDDNCPYLMFPVEGGLFNAVNKRIRQHEKTPIVSENKICIKSCTVAKPPIETTPKTSVDEERKKELVVTVPKDTKVEDSNSLKEKELTTLKAVSTTEVAVAIETKDTEDLDHGEPDSETDSETHNEHVDHKPHHTGETGEVSTKSVPSVAETADPPHVTTEKELTSALNPVFCSFDFKLLNAWKPSLAVKNSSDYKHLKQVIEEKFKSELESEVALRNVIVTDIIPFGESHEVIATVNVELLESSERSMNDRSVPLQLRETIKEIVANHKFGELSADSSSVQFKNSETNLETSPKTKSSVFQLSEEQLKWIVIIGGVAALVFLVVVQALCMLWKDNRNKKKNAAKEKQMVNSHWKDYSATTASSAYCYENFAVSDDLDGIQRTKHVGKSRNGFATKPTKCAEKGDYSTSYFNGTMDRHKYAKDRDFNSLHDRRDDERAFYTGSHTLPLQPDFYFMPHQRRYSGEVVRVFVDYNNPHPKNVRK